MPKPDPRFWEVAVDPTILDSLSSDSALWRNDGDAEVDEESRKEREELKQEALRQIAIIIRTRLTPKQQRILDLYFYQDKTQEEIAEMLGVSQQVVNKHLFGVVRQGQRIGGAVKKLRKMCEERGIDPKKWV